MLSSGGGGGGAATLTISPSHVLEPAWRRRVREFLVSDVAKKRWADLWPVKEFRDTEGRRRRGCDRDVRMFGTSFAMDELKAMTGLDVHVEECLLLNTMVAREAAVEDVLRTAEALHRCIDTCWKASFRDKELGKDSSSMWVLLGGFYDTAITRVCTYAQKRVADDDVKRIGIALKCTEALLRNAKPGL